ncbi:MAG TPA: beta-phosphoglucomutase [Albitalea sp.]|nr:beta-phosphoglucomutase [Albitalea sp.]
MSVIRGFVFDLDGVIVDTAKYHYLGWKRLAHTLGFDLTPQHNELLKGVSRMASLDIVLSIGSVVAGDADKLRYAAQKNAWYLEYVARMSADEILPNAASFIRVSRATGLRIALASASNNSMTILAALRIADLFDAVIDGTQVTHAKPDPEVFLKAACALALPPADCVVFEDAQAGVAGAVSAGMRCVGIGKPAQLSAADIVLRGFAGVSPDMILQQLASVD